MNDLNLPQDLVAFLKGGKQLQYDYKKVEPGKITLKSYSDLKIGAVWINSDESPLIKDDPHSGEKMPCLGLYESH